MLAEHKIQVEVSSSGAIILGSKVACDGFFAKASIRVQSHIHSDHMSDFNRSKLCQTIVCTEQTRDLLIAQRNADIQIRSNIRPVRSESYNFDGGKIDLVASGHMLGSVQTRVEYDDGLTVGYSGDFNWPLDNVIQVEQLVLDGTSSTPNGPKRFPAKLIRERFLDIVGTGIANGPVHIIGGRGTINRAAQFLFGEFNVPLIGPNELCKEIDVYRKYGYAIDNIVNTNTADSEKIMAVGPYIRLYGLGDTDPVGIVGGTVLWMSAYMSNDKDPILTLADYRYRLAMSDHADFEGTLEYVSASGAKNVVTDNSRGGKAITLAQEIEQRLGIKSRPSKGTNPHDWGG